MKTQLKKITDLTVNELLNNEVIMPSIYFEKFNKNAKTLEINLDDTSFDKELNKIIVEDFETIENYMNSIMSNVGTIQKAANDTKVALKNKDIDMLSDIYKQMHTLEKEVKSLNSKLFVDELTNTHNRKWIYNKYLNKEADFKSNGIAILIDVIDYKYIEQEYGTLIANNLLIFITNFIKKNLKEEGSKYKIARFIDNQFFIFVSENNEKETKNLIFNIKQLLLNTTLKSNSGLVIKGNFDFYVKSFMENQSSKEVFENLYYQINDE